MIITYYSYLLFWFKLNLVVNKNPTLRIGILGLEIFYACL